MKKIQLLLMLLLSFAFNVKAQIVYVDINPDLISGDWTQTILGTTFTTWAGGSSLATNPAAGNNWMDSTGTTTAILNQGAMIAPANNWVAVANLSPVDAVTDITDKYLGFRIGTAGNYRYGWFKFSRTNFQLWTLKSYAYQNTLNTAIAASDMGTTTVITPVAAFTANQVNAITNVTNVTFTDQTTNNPTTWAWSFTPNTVTYQAGTTAVSQNPQVKFTAPGSYSVQLTATNAGGSNTLNKPNYITVTDPVPQAPVAAFVANNTAPVATLTTVTFTDQSLNLPTSRSWSFTPNTVTFIGGTSATSTNPQVTFNAGGAYSVKLVVANALGADSLTKVNYINATVPPAPLAANFSADVTTAVANTTVVTLTDLSTGFPDARKWTITPNTFVYQNNGNSTTTNPKIIFTAEGNYSIKLKVTNTAGGVDSMTKMAYVHVTGGNSGTGIADKQLASNVLSVYPNPASDYLNIELKQDVKIQKVSVVNLEGKVIVTYNELKGNNINIAALSKGMYFMKIEFEKGSKAEFKKFSKL